MRQQKGLMTRDFVTQVVRKIETQLQLHDIRTLLQYVKERTTAARRVVDNAGYLGRKQEIQALRRARKRYVGQAFCGFESVDIIGVATVVFRLVHGTESMNGQ